MWPTKVKTSPLVTARLGLTQVIVPPVPTEGFEHAGQLPGWDSETKVIFPGSGSVKVASVAASGPLFVTVIV